jgi:hypothetical protein
MQITLPRWPSTKESTAMSDHPASADARSWDDLKQDLEFTAAERAEIAAGARRLLAEARASRLAEVRDPQP